MVTICEQCARQTDENGTYQRASVRIDDDKDMDPLPIPSRTNDNSGSATAPPQTRTAAPQKTGLPITQIDGDLL